MPRRSYRRYMYPSGPPRGEYTVEDPKGNGVYRYIKLSSTGRTFSFEDSKKQVEKGLNMITRWMGRIVQIVPNTDDRDLNDYYWEQIEDYCDRLRIIADRWMEEVAKHRKVRTKEERIKALRNTTGRTEEEAALFLAKADELEKEL